MKRRTFVKQNIAASALAGLAPVGAFAANFNENTFLNEDNFNLDYAPHLGMFRSHAGEDPIDQLNFMADQGFKAFEDNGMKGRAIALQEEMAATMAKRNIRMGVFVAHTIYWTKPNLASGDKDLQNEFLKEIRESVEVAKRVNAKWMTVVPGYVDHVKISNIKLQM